MTDLTLAAAQRTAETFREKYVAEKARADKLQELSDQLTKWLDGDFRAVAVKYKGSHPMAGWWSSNGTRDADLLGDRLVEAGMWIRHAGDRVKWYKPKAAEA